MKENQKDSLKFVQQNIFGSEFEPDYTKAKPSPKNCDVCIATSSTIEFELVGYKNNNIPIIRIKNVGKTGLPHAFVNPGLHKKFKSQDIFSSNEKFIPGIEVRFNPRKGKNLLEHPRLLLMPSAKLGNNACYKTYKFFRDTNELTKQKVLETKIYPRTPIDPNSTKSSMPVN